MQAIPMILKTMRAATRAIRVTAIARTAILACTTLLCCAAVWRAWRT